MKLNIHHLYYLFRKARSQVLSKPFYPGSLIPLLRSGYIIIALMLFSEIIIAQETPLQGEFPIGSFIGSQHRTDQVYYNSYSATSMNTISQQASESTRNLLENYNLQAINMDTSADYIYHYSTAYYSKWEAEVDADIPFIGVKHKFGKVANWEGASCWSTIDVSTPGDSLLFGPHYHQEKWYRRWLYKDTINMKGIYDVRYIPRWRMALDTTDSNLGPDDTVCRLSVWLRNAPLINGVWDTTVHDHRLKRSDILKVSDFQANGQFDYFFLDDDTTWYRYPERFQSTGDYYRLLEPQASSDTVWTDINGNNGVEFRVEWLRNDARCTLYIDYVEVYDDYGWKDYIDDPERTANKIITYADSFKTMGWSNITHWVGSDEPFTIDSYIPLRTVDSILRSNNAPPLLVSFLPYWDVEINRDSQLVRYYRTAKPDPLFVHFFPHEPGYISPRYGAWEAFRNILQISALLTGDKGFWYTAQNFGYQQGENWISYRQPDSSEQKAEVMLALAHGVKGMFFSLYDSETGSNPKYGNYIAQGLIGRPEANYDTTALWYLVRDNIVPRLKGKLGKTLMDLNYTGDYIQMYYSTPSSPQPITHDYLTVGYGGMLAEDMFWHCGFFNRTGYSEDKYFMLANLITTEGMNINVKVQTPDPGLINYRFRNIEGLFDTTIQAPNYLIKTLIYPPGEGYLYEFAPVIKYGGRLLYDETISSTTTLLDDMTIEVDAVLTVNNTYNVGRSITIKDEGSIVTTNGGTLKFYNDVSLIIEGAVTISGTFENPLVLDFINPADSNGIIIRPGGSLTISYCQIKNAATGIFSELNANYMNAQYIDFVDCGDYSISILGQGGEMGPTPVPQIISCSMTNSTYGISVSNLSSIIISYNTIMNTDCGIMLTNVSDAEIISNTIQSNTEEYPGIWYFSSGGVTRENQISGHTSACFLANSSPKLGKNTLTSNKYHGIYVGSGSNPYMQGEYAGSPPNRYIVSGYNEIFENGGYQETGGPADNDGSEIYFSSSTSNAVLNSGCNSIYDDRQASPPLINTLLLMSGTSSVFPITVNARNNFWGDTVYAARFSGINVNYIPYEGSPCLDSQGGGEEDEMVLMNQFGQVIDTVYSTGMEVPELSETELIYAEAEESFLIGDLTSALQKYETIISSGVSDEEKYLAYERKYTIGKLQSKPVEFFNSLSSAFANLAGNTQDSLAIKKLTQLSTLSKVGEQEYENAIADFDGIVQSNPNTEEAVYAEIDALTTALLIEGNDSTLQKGTLGKYLIKSSADYHQKVDEILRKHFGGASKENGKELIPTEYTLYQNYPNPFNPVTTLKYDLPEASDVSLIIYDILGRKVKELVNTKQQAGRYEIQFNATNFASGVYIYQLIADKFISSKKMLLVK